MHRFEIEEPSSADIAFSRTRLYEFKCRHDGYQRVEASPSFCGTSSRTSWHWAAGHTWGRTCELGRSGFRSAFRGSGRGSSLILRRRPEACDVAATSRVFTTHIPSPTSIGIWLPGCPPRSPTIPLGQCPRCVAQDASRRRNAATRWQLRSRVHTHRSGETDEHPNAGPGPPPF